MTRSKLSNACHGFSTDFSRCPFGGGSTPAELIESQGSAVGSKEIIRLEEVSRLPLTVSPQISPFTHLELHACLQACYSSLLSLQSCITDLRT